MTTSTSHSLTLKILSVLLSYPTVESLEALDDMVGILKKEALLPATELQAVLVLIERLRKTELLDLQESYVAQFDRGRYLSLHIFEHVHGESRDRGQAMVNLMEMYAVRGFELNSHELPDYIPLFLEFLAQQTLAISTPLLQDAMPVLSLLGVRLAERGSDFAAIFQALESLAGVPDGLDEIRQQVASETEDEILLHMDAIWEEEVISFMGNNSNCQSQTAEMSTVNIMPRAHYQELKSSSILSNHAL